MSFLLSASLMSVAVLQHDAAWRFTVAPWRHDQKKMDLAQSRGARGTRRLIAHLAPKEH